MLEDRLGMFERRACRITGQHRSTQRHRPKRRLDRDDVLRAELRALLREHLRWGYRKAWACLRDWCHFGGSGTSYIEPCSPWENPFVESFASRVRDEALSVEAFDSLPEAKIVIEERRSTYNTLRPHSSVGWKTPAANTADRRT